MLKYLFIVLFLITSFDLQAACYSREQAEADQGIRIHSELMVIGLNCQGIGARYGKNPYGDYRRFTSKNSALFASYEKTLMDFYTQNGMNAKTNLNDLRTQYANAISKVSAKQRPDVFCSRHTKRIDAAQAMTDAQLRQWASTFYDTHPVSYPLCQ